ncbi:hypothetical protein [Kineococcus glutinatus]|uniref:MarR family protein n=1 Tax=Kineococcus glutinatus TaxID=1070872 RepID=A0ABP9I320_9ACTN
MPDLTDDDRRIHDYLVQWYGSRRGALSAHDVAEATGIPCAVVSAAAGVLAAAGCVRTYRSPRLHGAEREVLFVGLVTPPQRPRTVDLRGAGARPATGWPGPPPRAVPT